MEALSKGRKGGWSNITKDFGIFAMGNSNFIFKTTKSHCKILSRGETLQKFYLREMNLLSV